MQACPITSFNFQGVDIRLISRTSTPLWIVTDVLKVLGIPVDSYTLNSYGDSEKIQVTVPTANGKQLVWAFTERGLYKSIFKSAKPKVVEFQNWIFDEILPVVRRPTHSFGYSANCSSGKILKYNALESEDALSSKLFDFLVSVCNHSFLRKEVPFLNTISRQPNTRRLDFIKYHSHYVTGIEVKLSPVIVNDIGETIGEKGYFDILKDYIANYDQNRGYKINRQIRFNIISPSGITDAAKRLLERTPEITFTSVQELCQEAYKKVIRGKYQHQKTYLNNLIINKYPELFSECALDYIKSKCM